ncbi:MAG TPA: hypothetical protein VJ521_16665 [Acidobacteriota bacterium]|nr:hypothetical protein [Acidobacteriota bacterium]
MAKLRVVKPKHTLIYSMKLLKNLELEDWEHEHVNLKGPEDKPITMVFHMIGGTKEEIKEQLLQSVDAFFELSDEMA